MKTYKQKLLFKILLTLFFLIAFICEMYMSINIVGNGSVTYREESSISHKEKGNIITLKYDYKNELDTIVKYDNTYSVYGVLSSYDENDIKLFEYSYKYFGNKSYVGESNLITLSVDEIQVDYQECLDRLKESELRSGKLIVYYNISIKAVTKKLINDLVIDNRDTITINIDEKGYTIDDKNSSTTNNMTIKDTTSKIEFEGRHLVLAIIAIVIYIILLVNLIKFITHHNEVKNSFENKLKRVTKGNEDRISQGKEMNYPKKVTYVNVDNFEELVGISKKAKDKITEYHINENEVIFAVRLEDEVYQYKVIKEE